MADKFIPSRKRAFKDISGQKFGRLTAIRFHSWYSHRTGRSPNWEYLCDCGKVAVKRHSDVKGGRTQSCGCLGDENRAHRVFENTKHGDCRKGNVHPVYKAWIEMHQRCENENRKDFPRWGGRGIEVLWESYEEFKSDMLPTWRRGLTIERKNNDGPYCKSNCIWATQKQQARNRRSNVFITFKGETMPMAAMADKYGISPRNLWARLRVLGWSVESALTTPIRRY